MDGREALEVEAWPELTRLNNLFHEAVAAATGNDHLVELMAAYGLKLAWIFSTSAQRRGAAAWNEHEGIVAAIADGDAELAEVLAARHIVRSQPASSPRAALSLRAGRRGGSEDGARRWVTLVALVGATFVGTVNNSVANVAVPDVSDDFGG